MLALCKMNDGIDLAGQIFGKLGIAQIGLYVLQVDVHGRTGAPEANWQKRAGHLSHNLLAKQTRRAGYEDDAARSCSPLPLTASCHYSSCRLGQQHRDAIRVGVMKAIRFHAESIEPRGDFFRIMLPSVVRMIPIEIDHVVGFVIERIVPEAFHEVVIEQPLHVMDTGRNAKNRNGLFQRYRRI